MIVNQCDRRAQVTLHYNLYPIPPEPVFVNVYVAWLAGTTLFLLGS